MANIFSGMFQGPASESNANSQALYKSQLEEWEALQEYKRRNEDIIDQIPAYTEATKDMTPERQAQMRFFQGQAGGRETGDKGLEGMAAGFKQRGGTIADNIAQAQKRKTHEANRLFDVDNPEAETTPSKVLSREHFIKQWRADPRNDQKLIDDRGYGATDAELSRISDRSEPYLEQGDQLISGVTGSVISKRMGEAGYLTEYIKDRVPRVVNFQTNVDDAEDVLNFAENRLDDIRRLSAETNGWTTGLMGVISKFIPASDADRWQALKDTIVSNIGLTKIMDLKAGSAQGATGLGALNEKELEMLQNHAGNLREAQTPQAIKDTLRRLERDLKRAQNRIMTQLPKELKMYNLNQRFLPDRDKYSPAYVPSEYQAELFSGGQYKRADTPGTTLDKDEMTREERLKKLTGG